MQIAQVIYEAMSLIVATVMGVACYGCMSDFARGLFVQLIVWDIFYLGSYIITWRLQGAGLLPDDQWWVNGHMPFEMGLLSVAAILFFQQRSITVFITGLYVLFLLILLQQMHQSGPLEFANYAYTVGSIFISFVYLLMLYKCVTTTDSWRAMPEFWMILGVVIYCACTIPYVSVLNYLITHQMSVAKLMFNCIVDVLANVRYFLLAYAFWMFRKQLRIKPVVS